MGNKSNKRGQITIFIILAVVIIAIIGLVFLLKTDKTPFVPTKAETNPRAFMSSCIEEKMEKNIETVLSQGGSVAPENYHMFNDFQVDYLCYNRGFLDQCINQHPMFLNYISNELKEGIMPEVQSCFSEFEGSMKKLGYDIELGEKLDLNVLIVPDKVYLNILKDITITKSGETSRFEEMNIAFLSSIYGFTNIANQIVNSEVKECYFENIDYFGVNPGYLILLKTMSDSTKIYTIQDKKTGEQMNIAIRGCVLP